MQNVPLKPTDKFLLTVVRYGLFALFLLPFVIWLRHLYPWVTGKIIWFQVIVEVLFPLYVLLAFRRQEFRPSKNPFLYALLAYFAVATLSMLLGSNSHRSFWSKPDRLTGMFFQYHLLAFFLMAGAVWRDILTRPIIASIISAGVLSAHAIMQVTFPAAGSDGRGSATLGNASYLGQYLVPHLFLCGWLALRYWKSGLRWLWLAAGLLVMTGIFTTKSKGALLGVAIGVLAATLIAAVRGRSRSKRYSLISLGLLALVVVAYLAGNYVQPFKRILYEERLSLQYFQETKGSRGLLLNNALKGIQQRPLTGWGPENFEDGYYFNYDPYTLRYSEYETRQDRPHNLVLEVMHNLGILGLLAYAAIFFFAVKIAVSRRRTDWVMGAGLVVAALSQLGTNLFIFETPMSYMALFFLFALIEADAAKHQVREEGPDESSQGAIPLAVIAALLSIWCLRSVIIGTVRSAKITSGMIVALTQQAATADDWKLMLADLRAQKTPYYERDIRALASHLSQTRGEYLSGDFKPILVDLAEDEYRLFRDRDDFVQALVTSSAYLSFQPRTPEQQAALEDAASRAAATSPNRHEVEVLLAQIAWEKGDLDEAERHLKRVVELDPGNPIGDGWWIRWQIEFRDPAEGVRYLVAHPAAQTDPQAWNQVEYGTLHLLNQMRWKELDTLQKASVEANVRNVQWDLTGAIAAWALGDKARSDAIIAEDRKLFPERLDLIESIASQRETIVKGGS